MIGEFHVEHPDQSDVHQGSDEYDCPHHTRDRGGYRKDPHSASFKIVIELPKGFGMKDFLPRRTGFEPDELFMESDHPCVSFLRNDSLLLRGPSVVHDISRVISEQPNKVRAIRFGVGADVS